MNKSALYIIKVLYKFYSHVITTNQSNATLRQTWSVH